MKVIDMVSSSPGPVRTFEWRVFGERGSLTNEEAMRIPQLSPADSFAQVEAKAAEELRQGKWNPDNPPTMTALVLQQAVQNALRLTPMLPVEIVKALGTSMDVHCGVDGYFKLAKTEIIVTVDLTTNPEKIRSGQRKADFLLTPADVSSAPALDAFAHKVAKLLRKRYKKFQHNR